MSFVSQTRADFHNHACEQPPDQLADLDNVAWHLVEMIYERTGRREGITYGDIAVHLEPTFDEARLYGRLRAKALNLALDMLDEAHELIAKKSFDVEVVDYMFDKLPLGQPLNAYRIWDVIEALRPSPEEAVQAAGRKAELMKSWNELKRDLEPKAEDGQPWRLPGDDDLDF